MRAIIDPFKTSKVAAPATPPAPTENPREETVPLQHKPESPLKKEIQTEERVDTLKKREFVKIKVDGRAHLRRKGYEDMELPKPKPKSIKEQWTEHRRKKENRV